ncbi:argininosuccinate synthase, chloroplastic-like isoform X2 [Trifolium pratense]|uniref:argininosuccinate synthase, chloroplastic-like isoform X2 n=1 Tax=Trifolium pratense TaxID=57577 RepID=UPI001E6971D1|nr:argininosuccinate synthase, chloroplastic-like isoform X2 [Trifolium pratense]
MQAIVDIAEEVGADAVSYSCTGKRNYQVRFELSFFALNPKLNVVAPWREWDITGREDAIEYANNKHNVLVPVTKKSIYSKNQNLCHITREGMYMLTADLEDAPNQPDLNAQLVRRRLRHIAMRRRLGFVYAGKGLRWCL